MGFTALPLWRGDGRKLVWKEFDIAAFKEALKVYNQFQQNVTKREEKLDSFATRLLVMDGERARDAYADEATAHLRRRLERIWKESGGKLQPPKSDLAKTSLWSALLGTIESSGCARLLMTISRRSIVLPKVEGHRTVCVVAR